MQILWVFAFFVSISASAATSFAPGITYSGRLTKADDTPVNSVVSFSVGIYDVNHDCLLYSENRTLNLSSSNGNFSFDIGDGYTGTHPTYYGNVSGLFDIFNNKKTFTGVSCSGGVTQFTPGADNEPRVLMITFDAGDGPQSIPALKINPVPSAFQAYRLSGYAPENLLRMNTSDVADPLYVNTTANANTPLNQTQYDEFWRLMKNPSAAYLAANTTLTGDVTGAVGTTKVIKIQNQSISATAPTAGQILTFSSGAWTPTTPAASVTSVSINAPLSLIGTTTPTISITKSDTTHDGYLAQADWNTFNNKQTSSLANGKIWIGNSAGGAEAQNVSGDFGISNTGLATLASIGAAGTYTKVTVDGKGRVTSGANLSSGDLISTLGYTPVSKSGDTMTGDLNIAAGKYLGLGSGSIAGTVAGQMWYDSGTVKYFDGTTTKSLGAAGSGIATLNGLSTTTQTFGTGTTGSDFNISSSGSGHIFNIPSASSSNRGALTSADWTTFNNKQGNSLTSANAWVGNSAGGAEARALSGDVTISSVGLVTLKNTGTVGTYFKVITDAQGRVVSGSALASSDITTALGYTPVNRAGDTMSGDLNTQNITMAANKYLGLSANTTNGTVAGQMWYDTGVIKYFDGTTVKSLGVAGSGISNLNGLTADTQSFVVGSAGSDFAISSSGSAHTFNLPSSSASNRGLLTSADWSTFSNKQNNALSSASVWVGNSSGGAQARALSGDVTISNAGLVTADKTTTAQSNKLLSLDGSSVGTMSGLALVSTGTVTLSATTASTTYSLKFPAAAPAANQVMQSDASGNLSWTTSLTAATGYVNGGNTFGGNASIGLTDAYNLDLKTSGSSRMTITGAGNVGIGTNSPGTKLQVNGAMVSAAFTTNAANSSSALSVDFSQGNLATVSTTGGNGNVILSNMVAGGSYNVVIQDVTAQTYDFTNGGSGSQCTSGNTRYLPANAATTVNKHSIYAILYAGSGVCYITWSSGF